MVAAVAPRLKAAGVLATLAVLLLALFAAAAEAQPRFPRLTGRVVDGANMLSPRTEADLTQRLAALEQRTGRQLVVATLPSLQGYEIEEYGYQLGRAWGIGSERDDDGVLFIVAPNERRTRIEVGYGLEPILTDALSSVILQETVLPRFRQGDMEGGVVAGANAIVEQLTLDAPAAQARVQQAAARTAPAEPPPSMTGIIITIIVIWFLLSLVRNLFRPRKRRGGMGCLLFPLLWFGPAAAGGYRRSSTWSGGGGGFGGGGFGGGGFSGGGGSFGGGGSSGGW